MDFWKCCYQTCVRLHPTFLKQGSPRLAGMVNWGTATVVGVFAGMLYGGSKEAAASVVSLWENAPKHQ